MAYPAFYRKLVHKRVTWYPEYSYRAGCRRERGRLRFNNTYRIPRSYFVGPCRLAYLTARFSAIRWQEDSWKGYCAHERLMRQYRNWPSAVDYEEPQHP